MGFVTGFRGRRDGYQVPAALAEAGLLDAFVTDHYKTPITQLAAMALPTRQAEKLLGRFEPLVPRRSVVSLRTLAIQETLFSLRGGDKNELYARFDPVYGKVMADEAHKRSSDVLAYSVHANAAFENAPKSARRILFQYHPHIKTEQHILLKDGVKHDQLDSGRPTHPFRISSDHSWKKADHIICASSFTKASLINAGASDSQISVIPYGIDLPKMHSGAPTEDGFRALFVGSGLYRKGLHHLLEAWRPLSSSKSARLTIVCRNIDPAIKAMVDHSLGNIVFLSGVSRPELDRLYSEATLFVMPSLIEGFGQVYLEALARGVPVLGTPNTCLPDLGGEGEGVHIVEPGNITMLTEMLLHLSNKLPQNVCIRTKARETATKFSWSRFRQEIAAICRA